MKRLCIIVLLLFYALAVSAQNPISVANIRYPNAHTVSEFSTDQDDLELPADYFHYRLSASTTVNVTGIVAMDDGIEIMLSNAGDNPITLKHESDSSTAANRFSFPGEADLILNKGQRLKLFYDALMSRWTTYGTGVGIGGLAPPADSPLNLMVAVTGTATADISWLQGGGDFAILLLSESPISDLPVDGVLYSANPEFGSGSNLGNDVFAVAIEADRGESTPPTTVTVSITGLTEATQYFVVVVNYNLSGALALYNRSISADNSTTFTTNASESTPTVPYTITRIETKEDSVIIYGIAGNGDARAVLMAENKEVDAFFEDDQGYSADDFGEGDEIGTGNYVVFNGVTESPIKLAGFERDKAYSRPYIAEYSSNKYLLPPAHAPPALLRTHWFYDEKFVQGSTPAGQTFLENNARVYYNFGEDLTGDDGDPISNGNPGLNDKSGNSLTATVVGTPTVEDVTVESETRKSARGHSTNALNTGSTGAGLFDSSFEIFAGFLLGDGQPASSAAIYGALSSNLHQCRLVVGIGGDLQFYYRTGSATLRYDADANAFADGPTGWHLVRVRYDFEGQELKMFLDGSEIVLTKVGSGVVSDNDPDDWAGDQNVYVAGINNEGSATSNGTDVLVTSFAVTGLLSDQQAADITDYLSFTAVESGDGYERWIVNETNGFSHSVSNDSLILSGQPLGFDDYLVTKELIPDSLFEFRVSVYVTINDEVQTGDSGIGIGIRNDTGTEPNRGVYGLFIVNPSSANYGRIQLYSGNGTITTSFVNRTTSSGAFVPEKDSTYILSLTRDIQGNDVVYSFSVTDLYDSTVLITAWTETGRPSDAYIGTTMRPFIYMNGGSFRLYTFQVLRTGDETGSSEDPTPPPFEADVYVQTFGNDANDCTQSQPCKTVNRGFIRIGELAPSVVDMFIGAGTYAENSFLSPPANTGEVRGAGRDLTFITGASNLYTSTTVTNPNRSSDSRALVSINNKGTVSMKFKSMTFLGNKNNGGTTNSIRHCFVINNTHGVELEDVAIRFFNTTGIKLGNVNTFRCENFHIESASGDQIDAQGNGITYYNIQTWNVGGGTPLVTLGNKITDLSETNYRIIFKDGLIEGQKSIYNGDPWSDGAGWGMVGGGGSDTTRYITNVLWDNVEFKINKNGVAQHNGHRFNMEGLYFKTGNILIKNCKFNNNLSWGGLSDLNSSLGPMRVTGCTFKLEPNPPTFVIEMQASHIEIDHNFVDGARNGVFVSLNNQNTFSSQSAMWPVIRGDHGKWEIHHNIIRLLTAQSYGMFGGAVWELHDYKIYNNTIHFTTTQSVASGGNQNWYAIFTSNNSGSVSTGLVYENNAFVGIPPSPSQFWDSGGMSGGIHRYNVSGRIGSTGTPFNVAATRSGVTSSNNTVYSSGSNTLGLGLGTPPTTWEEAFNGNYYRPGPGSMLIDAGQDGKTIGALEPN